MNEVKKGTNRSTETKIKISKALLGTKYSPESLFKLSKAKTSFAD
jgi:hypothetical protein